MNKVLWVLQILLALAFFMAGAMKLMTPIAELSQMMGWVEASPDWLVRFIGLAEVLGALGLIMPAATRIQPILTPIAAACLTVVMVLALLTHLTRGEYPEMIAPIVLGIMAVFVAYGRFKLAPIAPKGQDKDPAPA